MIGLARSWEPASWLDPTRIASSLGLFAGHPCDFERTGSDWLFDLPTPRAPVRRGWHARRTRSGLPLLFHGWLDDRDDLARELNIAPGASDELYAAAFEAWGDQADRRINGTYVAVIPLPDGRIRLSRSPLGSFPLFYAADRDALAICSIPRPIFAAGWPQKLRERPFRLALSFQLDTDGEASFWEGLRQIPDGSIAYLSRGGITIDRWYDVTALPDTRLRRDADYVEAAHELLARSVTSALSLARKPALTLSGGLDSALVAAEVLRQLPQGRTIPSFTFHPLDAWKGTVPAGNFADDRPAVREFAKMYPQLDARFVDNQGVSFDHKAREMFLGGHSAFPAMTVGTPHHGVLQAAAEAGCDMLLSANTGNMTFSQTAPWAFPEFLRTGRWIELWKLAANRTNDSRSMARRIVAHAVMPHLPADWRSRIRTLVHGSPISDEIETSLLRRSAMPESNYSATHFPEFTSQRLWIAHFSNEFGLSAETVHAAQQVFGIQGRDVTAYRPFVEFCFTIPTDQFVRGGETRWLARRMGEGRIPEAQRTQRLYGRHNADWFLRLTPRVPDMKQMVRGIAAQPELAPHIDTDRAMALLDNWPENQPADPQTEVEMRFVLPSILLMSQFVDFVTGRNPE